MSQNFSVSRTLFVESELLVNFSELTIYKMLKLLKAAVNFLVNFWSIAVQFTHPPVRGVNCELHQWSK